MESNILDIYISRAAVVHLNFRAGSTQIILYRPYIGLIQQTLRLYAEFTFTKGAEVRVRFEKSILTWSV